MKGAGMKLVYIASPLRGENPSGKDYKKNIDVLITLLEVTASVLKGYKKVRSLFSKSKK